MTSRFARSHCRLAHDPACFRRRRGRIGSTIRTLASSVVSHAERFAMQYRQFKMQDVQTKAGTPLTHVNFLTEARRAELRALNIYTVEALAHVDGQELKISDTADEITKNKADAYLEDAKHNARTRRWRRSWKR